jgi:lysyl-tRNA synthetase class II
MAEEQEEREVAGLEKLRGVRIEKMEALRAAGANPYPYRYQVTHNTGDLTENEAPLIEGGVAVSIAGRDDVGIIACFMHRDAKQLICFVIYLDVSLCFGTQNMAEDFVAAPGFVLRAVD